jgi:hypothetical protein
LAFPLLGKPRRQTLAGPAAPQFIEHSTLHCKARGNGGGLQMIPGTILNFVPLLLGLFAAQPTIVEQSVTRLVIQDEVILRVPLLPRRFLPQFEWEERKGPKCIPIGAIQRAFLTDTQQIDIVLVNHARMRAQLDEDCPGLDFYGDFYLQPQDDRICAGRDAIHSRMGGSCAIERFKQLVPKFRH